MPVLLAKTSELALLLGRFCLLSSISIIGLVFFSVLIGNMQKYLQYLQSIAVREETMRATKQAAEQWMDNRMLPQDLRARIRRYEQYKWQETKGVEEESLLGNLPRDIRRDIKRHLCFSLLRRVPFFEKMNEQLLDAMCDRLKPVLYSEMSYTIREGDPVEEIVFITQGKLLSCTTNGGSSRLLNCCDLKDGDFFGEELLTWALDPQSSNNNLPNSTTTLQTKTGVKAFSLMADELKVIFTQFRRRHSRILRHTFRYHSLQWRTWAACFIQTAWRRRCRRKLEEKDRVQDAMAKEVGASASLGAITHASKSVINVQSLPPFPLGKPFEPDFAA
ncbi:hypothetical protein F0562_012332 [Nyssa sinensis]|uniref:Cyclic nucleotide-binding domain-containing protein n=1 Tax=Nyssa sinensis TaxID=561372 RepID=A0A5J4ZVE7_9ASTE|nr:hypothetical protein F0562_012332 [Nyssa sinensis]